MATKKQLDAINLYASLMEEIKIRLISIEHELTMTTSVPAIIIREFCFLQLRMICESIALGCLVAHGGRPATRHQARTGKKSMLGNNIIKGEFDKE